MLKFLVVPLLLGISNAGFCNTRLDIGNGKGGKVTLINTNLFQCAPKTGLLFRPIGNANNAGACAKTSLSVKLVDSNVANDIIPINTTIKIGANACGTKVACNAILGSTDACKYGQATKSQWHVKFGQFSAFCAAVDSTDVNGTSLLPYVNVRKYRVRSSLSCCTNGNKCNEGGFDPTGCTEDVAFSTFVQRTYRFWDQFKFLFLSKIACNEAVRNFTENCRTNKRWDQTKRCRRRVLCSKPVRKILQNFAARVCSNVVNPKYGAYLSQLLEDEYGDICPHLDLSCNNDGTAVARRRLRRLLIRLKVKYTVAQLKTAVVIAKIKAAIAKLANVAEDDVTVDDSTAKEAATTSSKTSNSRRLSGSSSTIDVSVDSDADTNLVNAIDCAATAVLGAEDSNIEGCDKCSAEVETSVDANGGQPDVTAGSQCLSTSAANGYNMVAVSIVVFVSFIVVIFV